MATIHVDGKSYEVDGSDNLLHACLSLGLDIPYFCWHPALGSAGACRQCAVKMYRDADDHQGRIVMSCMTPSADNTWISIDDEEARAFRASVIEFLMVNHPHDCAVCEEGGNCHLQDMTVMSGHNDRRFRFDKRTHHNQDLGPFINHEMNRCIACYRCVRFYNDYAQGTDFTVFSSHDSVYFGRVTDGLFDNEFSGNLVEVCPTGVFTDRTHSERYNRKWDMQFAPSICQQCAVGCNTSPGERYGELRRIENRFNGDINHYFLCDRGRFGYGYVNREDRPRQMLARAGSAFEAASVDGGLERVAVAMHDARLIGIGSPRASMESNFALQRLVGAGNFSRGTDVSETRLLEKALQILRHGAARTPSLRDIESCDAILILGEDPTTTAPRVSLAVRQALKQKAVELAATRRIQPWQAEAVLVIGQDERHPLFVATVDASRLDDVAQRTLRIDPERIVRLGFAIAHAIDPAAPAASVAAEDEAFVNEAANALMAASRPLVISGTGMRSEALLDACANIGRALAARGSQPSLSLSVPEVNSMGVAMFGGCDVERALDAVDENTVLFVLENDLYRRTSAARVVAALERARCVVVIDHQLTPTAQRAHLLLPAASFAEATGTVINNAGRAQRFFQVYDPAFLESKTQIRQSWRWLTAIQASSDLADAPWESFDELLATFAREHPQLAGIVDAAPGAGTRIEGQRIARMPPRYSGRTSLRADISVHEPRMPQDADSALAFSMEGYGGPLEPGALTPFAWAPGWNSPQAWNKLQKEVGGHLKQGDPGVRLIENDATAGYAQAATATAPAWQVSPLYHLFGSEELSARAPVAGTVIQAPYVALHPQDAAALHLASGQTVRVTLGEHVFSAALQLRETLARGVVGVPAGLPDAGPVLAGAGASVQAGEAET